MKAFSLVLKEIRFRKLNFLLSLAAVVSAASLFIVFVTVGESYRNETRKIQLGMGQNLRIIPKETRMDRFWAVGYSEYTLPEQYVQRFAELEGYEYTHLTATLQRAIEIEGHRIVLTGILPEIMPPGRNQKPIMFSVERGETFIGSEVARLLRISEGAQMDLLGRKFQVKKALSPTGSNDDIMIFGHLKDVQDLLGLEGRINEIRALECLCVIESGQTEMDALSLAEAQLAEIMPEGKVILLKGIADVREQQRATMEGFLGLLLPLVIISCGVLVGILSMINVRDRYDEIGILRAIGFGTNRISAIFIGRALILGLAGAPLGFLLGGILALEFSPQIFKLTAGAVTLNYGWFAWLLLAVPAFTSIAAFIPIVAAVTWDPVRTINGR